MVGIKNYILNSIPLAILLTWLICWRFVPFIPEWVSYNIYHKAIYNIFSGSLYFPFWFFIINSYVLPPCFFSMIFLICYLGQIIKFKILLVSVIAILFTLLVVFVVVSIFACIIHHKDIKDILNNNYITENIQLDEGFYMGRSKRKRTRPEYYLGKQPDTFYQLDLIGYNTISEYKNNIEDLKLQICYLPNSKFILKYNMVEK